MNKPTRIALNQLRALTVGTHLPHDSSELIEQYIDRLEAENCELAAEVQRLKALVHKTKELLINETAEKNAAISEIMKLKHWRDKCLKFMRELGGAE